MTFELAPSVGTFVQQIRRYRRSLSRERTSRVQRTENICFMGRRWENCIVACLCYQNWEELQPSCDWFWDCWILVPWWVQCGGERSGLFLKPVLIIVWSVNEVMMRDMSTQSFECILVFAAWILWENIFIIRVLYTLHPPSNYMRNIAWFKTTSEDVLDIGVWILTKDHNNSSGTSVQKMARLGARDASKIMIYSSTRTPAAVASGGSRGSKTVTLPNKRLHQRRTKPWIQENL